MKTVSAFFTALATTCALALGAATAHAQPTAGLPRHPQLTEGVLSNGLRYMIQPTKTGGMDFRLLVQAGSFDELEEERGFAHFVEHMAFRQTRKYKDGDINAFIRRLGLNFGQHLNAFTTFDRTGYFLVVPETKRDEGADEALSVLREWASYVQFPANLVNPERGVVQSEKRVRDQQHEDIHKLRKLIYSQPEYEREVIGTDTTLANASSAGLEGYYKRNYTAERMTVVIAGQLTKDVAFWERQIKEMFADVPRGQGTPKRPVFDIKERTRVMAVEYGGSHAASLTVMRNKRIGETAADLRSGLVSSLANSILTRRLDRVAKATPGLTSASVTDSNMSADASGFDLTMAMTGSLYTQAALDALKREFGQLRYNPPSAEEIQLASEPILQSARNAVGEQDKVQPSAVAGTLMNVAAYGGYYMDAAQYLNALQTALPTITADDISKSLAERTRSNDIIVTAFSPKGAGKLAGVEATLQAAAVGLDARPQAAQASSQRPLSELKVLAKLPTVGKVVSEKKLPYEITEWVLSNGMTVWLRNVSAQSNNQLVFQMLKRDGTYAFAPDLIPAARVIQGGALTVAGVGDLDEEELTRFAVGKTANIQTILGEASVGFSGNAVTKDVEFLFQGVHAIATKPRHSPVLFDKLKATLTASASAQQTQPEFTVNETWRKQRLGSWPQLDATLAGEYVKVSQDDVQRLHRRMYGDAAKFITVITGNVDEAVLKPLVERYLASLPGGGKPAVDEAAKWLVQHNEKQGSSYRQMDNPAARTRLTLRIANPLVPDSTRNSVLSDLASQVFSERLRNRLREQEGLTYSPGLRLWTWSEPFRGSSLQMDATVDPKQFSRARDVMLEVVADMLSRPANETEMAAAKAGLEQARRDADRNASQVASTLTQVRLQRKSIDDWLENRTSRFQSTSTAELQDFINLALKGIAPSILEFGPKQN